MRHEGFNKSKKRRQVKKNCVVYFEQGKNKFANFWGQTKVFKFFNFEFSFWLNVFEVIGRY